jgi:hypothetical protein
VVGCSSPIIPTFRAVLYRGHALTSSYPYLAAIFRLRLKLRRRHTVRIIGSAPAVIQINAPSVSIVSLVRPWKITPKHFAGASSCIVGIWRKGSMQTSLGIICANRNYLRELVTAEAELAEITRGTDRRE